MAKLAPYIADVKIDLSKLLLIPSSWEIEAAQFIFNEVRDGTHDSPKAVDEGVPLVTSKNLKSGVIDLSNTKIISISDHEEISKRSAVQEGDILFSMIGTIGNVAVIPKECEFSVKNVGLFRKNAQALNERFSYYWLCSDTYQKYLEGKQRGGNQKFVSLGVLRESPVPLPPLAEQAVIAQTLDTLLAQVDNIKTRLDAIPKILKTFRQSVLTAAVSGKLTEEWRGENKCESSDNYSMTVNALRVERHSELQALANRKSKYKDALEPIDNVIVNKPINWKVFSLDEVTFRITYGLTVRPAYVDEGVPIISAKEIKTGLVDYAGAKKFDTAAFGSQREKCKIFLNDVLFSKTGSIGHVARVTEERPICSSQNIAVLSPLVNSKYLEIVMRSPYIQDLASRSVKANAIPDLQLGIMARFPIPCPFELEQTQIVCRVEELFAFADQVEHQVKNAQMRVNNLTQSILAKAFRGELTSQWRVENPDLITGDNSAEALLKKIQEERRKIKESTKTKKAQKSR